MLRQHSVIITLAFMTTTVPGVGKAGAHSSLKMLAACTISVPMTQWNKVLKTIRAFSSRTSAIVLVILYRVMTIQDGPKAFAVLVMLPYRRKTLTVMLKP